MQSIIAFRIANELEKYQLTLGSFLKGDAGDSFSYHNGMRFSMKDQDNEISATNCVQKHNGAWWYRDCHASNLNGAYLRGYQPSMQGQGVNWESFRGSIYSLKKTEMKICPTWFKP